MEAIQGAVRLPFQAVASHGLSTLRPISSSGCCFSNFSSRRFNALAAKIPAVKNSGSSCRAVVTMGEVQRAYAGALAELAKSKNCLEAINSDVENLIVYFENPQMSKFFSNPVISGEKKKEILKSIGAEIKLNVYTLNFLYLLVDKRRISLTLSILRGFEELYYKFSDTQIAIVTSAVKIENAQLAQIAKKVQAISGAKNIKMRNVIDSSVIAGFSVAFGTDGSLFLDLTVKGQLDAIAAKMLSKEDEDSSTPAQSTGEESLAQAAVASS